MANSSDLTARISKFMSGELPTAKPAPAKEHTAFADIEAEAERLNAEADVLVAKLSSFARRNPGVLCEGYKFVDKHADMPTSMSVTGKVLYAGPTAAHAALAHAKKRHGWLRIQVAAMERHTGAKTLTQQIAAVTNPGK